MFLLFQTHSRKMSTRKDKIMALIPPSTSDLDESSDDENILSEYECIERYSVSSEAPSLSSSIRDQLEDIFDNSDTDIASEQYHEEENFEPETIELPMKKAPQCSNIPTHTSVFTPRKTRSHSKKIYAESNVENKEKKEDSEEISRQQNAKRKRSNTNKKKYNMEYTWSNGEFEFPVDIPNNEFLTPNQLKTPLEYFKMFFSDDLIQLTTDNTNLYSVQETGKSINISDDEVSDFIAIHILMGIVDMPSYLDYWSNAFRYEDIAEIMSLKRYQQIRRYIHFVNNRNQNDDPYFKVRPVLDIVRRNCLQIDSEKKQSIDEMMVPYKGKKAGSRRQYIKSKPKKWGFKIFVRAGISGFVYDFIVYGGDGTFTQHQNFTQEEMTMGLGAKIVIGLCQSIKNAPCTAIYFDNFFSSLDLLYVLRYNYGILSLGTIRTNRLQNCDLQDDKVLRKKGRGSFCCRSDNTNKITCVKWYDNKAVSLVSTYVSIEPVTTAKRYDKNQKAKVDVACPNIVKQYNAHMGGVDLMDMLISLYRIPLRTRRWYLSIFAQMVDICLNNAWLLYRRERELLGIEAKKLSLKEFRRLVAQSLKLKNKVKRKRTTTETIGNSKKIKRTFIPRPPIDVCNDKVDHFPIYSTKGRCRECKTGETHWICTKCNARLCLVKNRNCFYTFHHKIE